MLSFVVFDIETYANEKSDEYFLHKKYDAPGNYKDPEKIKAAIGEKRAKDLESAALNWWTGQVVCISALTPDDQMRTWVGHNEVEVLIGFGDYLHSLSGNVQLVGKNSRNFDVPFLVGRYMANDLGVPNKLRVTDYLRDIDNAFAYSSQCNQISSLSNYAWGLGIEGKTGHGSQVAALVNEAILGDPAKWAELADYCVNDVAITAEFVRRWSKVYKPSTSEAEARQFQEALDGTF